MEILQRSGKVRMVDDIMSQNRPQQSTGRVLFKDIPQEQVGVVNTKLNTIISVAL